MIHNVSEDYKLDVNTWNIRGISAHDASDKLKTEDFRADVRASYYS